MSIEELKNRIVQRIPAFVRERLHRIIRRVYRNAKNELTEGRLSTEQGQPEETCINGRFNAQELQESGSAELRPGRQECCHCAADGQDGVRDPEGHGAVFHVAGTAN